MHAIAGIIRPGLPPALAASPQRMFDRMRHSAAHTPGSYRFASLGLHVGWLTPAHGAQPKEIPAWSASGQVGAIMTGEQDLSGTAGGNAAATSLATDYEHFGVSALRQLNGCFSGLILDLRDRSVVLFNDRYGRGRIYYHESAAGFFFASEAKSLLAVLPHLRQLDARSLAEWFSVGCVLQDRTLFQSVALLPPASAWIFHRDGRVAKNRFFDPHTWEQQTSLTPAEYAGRLRDVFRHSAARVAPCAPDTALSLTGGLDSRAMLAWAEAEPGALPCYTFGGPHRDCADVLIARRLAAICRQPHTTIRLGASFFSDFAALAERSVYLSDGAMDVSGAVELQVNQQARQIAAVRLTGNYGSEVLRAHVAFRPGRLDRSLFTPEFGHLLDTAEETYRTEAACHRLTFIAFKQVPWHHHARFAIEKSQLVPRSPFLDNDLVALAYQAPPALAGSAQPLIDLIAAGNSRLAAVATDRGLRRRDIPLVSRVARSWHAFTAKAEYASDYGMPHWLTRATRVLPRLRWERLFLGRHKFYHFRSWYRDPLADAVRALADTDRAASFCYREGAPGRLVEEHLSGRANHTTDLHRLLSLRCVERRLLNHS